MIMSNNRNNYYIINNKSFVSFAVYAWVISLSLALSYLVCLSLSTSSRSQKCKKWIRTNTHKPIIILIINYYYLLYDCLSFNRFASSRRRFHWETKIKTKHKKSSFSSHTYERCALAKGWRRLGSSLCCLYRKSLEMHHISYWKRESEREREDGIIPNYN